jgi:transcriptional regulator with XRE-family HTH domain
MVKIGEKLKELRQQKGITQKQVAEYLEIAVNSYQSIEYGKINPSYDNLVKLAGYLEVPSEFRRGLSEERERGK